jgi:hypothetical protein
MGQAAGQVQTQEFFVQQCCTLLTIFMTTQLYLLHIIGNFQHYQHWAAGHFLTI